MKKMTCRDMGGSCDTELSAETNQEMMDAGWKHVQEAHPEMAEDIKKMPKESSAKWKEEVFDPAWDAAPEVTV